MRHFKVLPLIGLIALGGCGFFGDSGGGGGAPQITTFSADPTNITAPNTNVTLSWTVSGAVTELEITADNSPSPGPVSGTSLTVTPAATTTYTLTASNSSGDDTATATVTLNTGTDPTPPAPPGTDTAAPTGTFGVSESAEGPFLNDRTSNITSSSDERVLKLEAGDTFYVQVQYSDPSGVAAIAVRLANANPPGLAGTLAQGQEVGGFSLVGPVASCDLSASPTNITCVYEVSVGDDVVNIDQLPDAASEFAYVFRTNVTDGAGNVSNTPPRGYVTVGAVSTPEPPTTPPEDGGPTASFTAAASGSTVTFDASASTDPEGDLLSYAWTFGDGSAGTGGTVSHTYGADGSYSVTLTVTDPDGQAASTTQTVVIGEGAPGDDEGAPSISEFTAEGNALTTVSVGDPVELEWTLGGAEATSLTLSNSNGDGDIDVTGESDYIVTPTAAGTTVYTLSAANGEGEDTAEVTVIAE